MIPLNKVALIKCCKTIGVCLWCCRKHCKAIGFVRILEQKHFCKCKFQCTIREREWERVRVEDAWPLPCFSYAFLVPLQCLSQAFPMLLLSFPMHAFPMFLFVICNVFLCLSYAFAMPFLYLLLQFLSYALPIRLRAFPCCRARPYLRMNRQARADRKQKM